MNAARRLRDKLLLQEDLNFLLTNRVPRHALTHFMGWFSRIENPLLLKASLALWRLFTELDLSDARHSDFKSLHAVFTRELKAGARPLDTRAHVLASPCDAIVGAHGTVQRGQVLQAKGLSYPLPELLGSVADAAALEGARYVTLRLTSAMYHRFHAPHDGTVEHVRHISGDTWNVNPIALARIERLFCRNERAVLRLCLAPAAGGGVLTLVPVAAILVASLKLHCLPQRLNRRYVGPNELPCHAPVAKGQELGWFEHGSTVIVFAPPSHEWAPGLALGQTVRMGQALFERRAAP
jgi:phosphatidylserine decarboxylase